MPNARPTRVRKTRRRSPQCWRAPSSSNTGPRLCLLRRLLRHELLRGPGGRHASRARPVVDELCGRHGPAGASGRRHAGDLRVPASGAPARDGAAPVSWARALRRRRLDLYQRDHRRGRCVLGSRADRAERRRGLRRQVPRLRCTSTSTEYGSSSTSNARASYPTARRCARSRPCSCSMAAPAWITRSTSPWSRPCPTSRRWSTSTTGETAAAMPGRGNAGLCRSGPTTSRRSARCSGSSDRSFTARRSAAWWPLAYATRHPAHPRKLIVVSAEAAGDSHLDRRVALFERFGGPEVGAPARPRFLEAPGQVDMTAVQASLRLAFPVYTRTARDPNVARRAVQNLAVAQWFTRPGGEGHTFNLLPDLSRVQCPTLVLGGEDDPMTPIECQADIAAALPPHLVRFERFPGCGHAVPPDAAARALAVIRDFIAR